MLVAARDVRSSVTIVPLYPEFVPKPGLASWTPEGERL
jgi:hypothetical protein